MEPLNENIYPEVRAQIGRPLKFKPEQLLAKFKEYVQWCKDNPITLRTTVDAIAANGTHYGNTTTEEKPRLVSIGGFLVFLGASRQWWDQLDTNRTRQQDFLAVKGFIRDFCEEYQKEMASSGLFNGNIISRLLGLADKKQVEATGEGITIVVANAEQKTKIENISELDV